MTREGTERRAARGEERVEDDRLWGGGGRGAGETKATGRWHQYVEKGERVEVREGEEVRRDELPIDRLFYGAKRRWARGDDASHQRESLDGGACHVIVPSKSGEQVSEVRGAARKPKGQQGKGPHLQRHPG